MGHCIRPCPTFIVLGSETWLTHRLPSSDFCSGGKPTGSSPDSSPSAFLGGYMQCPVGRARRSYPPVPSYLDSAASALRIEEGLYLLVPNVVAVPPDPFLQSCDSFSSRQTLEFVDRQLPQSEGLDLRVRIYSHCLFAVIRHVAASGVQRHPAYRWVVESTLAWLSRYRTILIR